MLLCNVRCYAAMRYRVLNWAMLLCGVRCRATPTFETGSTETLATPSRYPLLCPLGEFSEFADAAKSNANAAQFVLGRSLFELISPLDTGGSAGVESGNGHVPCRHYAGAGEAT
eukprot:2950291-Rhodomonas_salina.1